MPFFPDHIGSRMELSRVCRLRTDQAPVETDAYEHLADRTPRLRKGSGVRCTCYFKHAKPQVT